MLHFSLTFRELCTTYSCISTMAAVQGSDDLDELAGFYRAIIDEASCADVVDVRLSDRCVECGCGDS